MRWPEICKDHPDKWLIVEALEAHTTSDYRRHLNRLTVVEECPDGRTAMKRYQALHHQYPEREYYYLHTSRDSLDIQLRQSSGIRALYVPVGRFGAGERLFPLDSLCADGDIPQTLIQ